MTRSIVSLAALAAVLACGGVAAQPVVFTLPEAPAVALAAAPAAQPPAAAASAPAAAAAATAAAPAASRPAVAAGPAVQQPAAAVAPAAAVSSAAVVTPAVQPVAPDPARLQPPVPPGPAADTPPPARQPSAVVMMANSVPGTFAAGRLRAEPAASRLRCWQHGVAVLDEQFTGPATIPAGMLVSAGPGANPRITVFGQGTGLCVVTAGPGAEGRDWR